MKVEYTLTTEDYVATNRFDWKYPTRREDLRWVWAAAIMMGLVGSAILAGRLTDPEPFPVSVRDWVTLGIGCLYVFFLLFMVLSTFIGDRIRVYLTRRVVRRSPMAFTPRTLAIPADGLTTSDPTGTLTIGWPFLVRIAEDGERAFFYCGEKQAFILPKHAFADKRDFEQFVATARRYHEEARQVRPEGEA